MGLDYQTVRESDAPGVQGAGVLRSGSLIVIPESLAPDGPGPRSYFGSKSPALRVVPAASVPEVNAILGSSLLSGELTTQGVVIDGTHAALWGIGVGDRVAIPGPRDEDCVVSVSGVSRPYESPVSQDESGDGGQILLPETLCVSEREEAVAEADSRGSWEIYNDGGTTKTQMIVNSLLSPQNYAIAVVLVLVTGLLLWMLVAVRSASRTARAVIEDAMALVRIGVTPRRVRRFARLLSGLSVIVGRVPEEGEARVLGDRMSAMGENERARLRLAHFGFVRQDFDLIRSLTATQNVAVPLRLRGISKRESLDRAHAALSRLGLDRRAQHLPRELSGGEQQRVSLARAIVGEPEIVLADEPTGSLDVELRDQALDVLNEAVGESTLILVTHDAEVCRRLGARQLRLAKGVLHAEQ